MNPARLSALVAGGQVDAVITVGGTGVGPRDRTPEATTAVMERSLPGLSELMRRAGADQTPFAVLSRAVAGVAGKTLLINLPGSPRGARDSLGAILEVLGHAVEVIHGDEAHKQGGGAVAAGDSAPAEEPPAGDPAGG